MTWNTVSGYSSSRSEGCGHCTKKTTGCQGPGQLAGMLAGGAQKADRNSRVFCRLIHCGNRYKVPSKKGGTPAVDPFVRSTLHRRRRTGA